MKKIYCIIRSEYLNGEKLENARHSKWHYGELPKIQTQTYTDFDEIFNKFGGIGSSIYCDVTFFKKRPYIYGTISWDQGVKIFKEDFNEYKIIDRVNLVEGYTMKHLIEELSADDLIAYLKDNGLNTCPIS